MKWKAEWWLAICTSEGYMMKAIPYFDGHCDTVYRCYCTGESMMSNQGHVAFDRLDGFSRYAQIFTFFWDAAEAPPQGMFALAKEMYALFCGEVNKSQGKLIHCRSAQDVAAHMGQGKVCGLLSIEGGDLLDCNPEYIETASEWGVKIINPTWNRANGLSGSHCEDSDRGLSDVGRVFVRNAEQAGILMDVSHLSEKGFWDLMNMTSKPVVASHSNARSVHNHSRSLTDDQFRAICQSGGVVGLNFYTAFVGEQPTMEQFQKHLEHFLMLGGENHIALGADFDGCDSLVQGIGGVQDIPALWNFLAAKGYSEELLNKLFWENWLRIM